MRVAVIGVGEMGKNHVRVYSQLKDVELVAIADVNEERVKEIAEKYRTEWFTDYKKMLKEISPDAVSVVVPTSLHKIVTIDSLNAGCNVLVEKPIASTLEEGKEMIKKAREEDLKLTVGHIERFNPMVRVVREEVERMHKVFSIEIHRTGPFPRRIRDVGVIIDLGTHDFDLMRFIKSGEIEKLYCEVQYNVKTEFEDLAKILLRFKDSTLGFIDVNWLTPTKNRTLSVLGDRGMFVGDFITQDLVFYENPKFNDKEFNYAEVLLKMIEGPKKKIEIEKKEPLMNELKHFIECVKKDKEPLVKPEDGLMALYLAIKALESMKKGQPVVVRDKIF